MGDIQHRTRLLGVRTDQERNIVLLARSERLVGRSWKHIRLDHRMNDPAGIAGEQGSGKLAQFLERARTQRSGILLSVEFCIGQQELWSQLERLKQAAALSNGALKQALGERRRHQDADRY